MTNYPVDMSSTPRLEGHDQRDALRCFKCLSLLMLDSELRVKCPKCGRQTEGQLLRSLDATRAAWPPPSQEARAASTGQTRTK